MDGPREGGCQCGSVRYRLEGETVALAVCHCTECQRQSGSAFGMSLIVRSASFRLLSGELGTFTRPCDSGRTLECAFCTGCGTRIYHRGTFMQDVVSIKPGTLDDTSRLAPTLHVWTKRKQPWVLVPEGVRTYEGEPE